MCSDQSSVTVTDIKQSVATITVTVIFTMTTDLNPLDAQAPIWSCPLTTWKANDPGQCNLSLLQCPSGL